MVRVTRVDPMRSDIDPGPVPIHVAARRRITSCIYIDVDQIFAILAPILDLMLDIGAGIPLSGIFKIGDRGDISLVSDVRRILVDSPFQMGDKVLQKVFELDIFVHNKAIAV